jgi:hypothetical protein
MKTRSIIVLIATTLLLSTGNALAGSDQEINSQIKQTKFEAVNVIKRKVKNEFKRMKPANQGVHLKVPEIDAKSGIRALALLAGVFLLLAEIVWSRRI